MHNLSAVTFLVRDYDEAIRWFTDCLGFRLLEDTLLAPGKRWVKVAPASCGSCLLLAKAVGRAQLAAIGKAAGGRVAFFLQTNDFEASHRRMADAGVRFQEDPRDEPYGVVAVFRDLYGNGWDLIMPK